MSREGDTGEARVLTIGLLGPLRVARSAELLPLGGRQQKAILAILLVNANTVVSLDRLADAVWGERVPAGAVATIQAYVSHLRDVLEPDRARGSPGQVLITERGGYRLRTDAIALESATFEAGVRRGRTLLVMKQFAEASNQLAMALALWRGPVLADLADFEFVRPAADHFDKMRLSAVEDRIEADLALGRHADLTGELDELITAHPLRERLHRSRMLALYRCGRQSEALLGYQELRTLLADELGIDPSPPVQQLYQAILAQDPDLELPARHAEVSGTDDAPPAATTRSPRRRRRVVVGAFGVVVLAVGGAALLVHRSTPTTLSSFPANSVGHLDGQGALRSAVRVGQSPAGVAYGAGSLWVANAGNDTVSRVDPGSNRVVQTISVGASPSAVTVTGDDVWITNGGAGTVSRVNAQNYKEIDVIRVGNQPTAIAGNAHGVWVANSGDDTIRRIDPITGKADDPIPVGGNPDGIAVGDTTVWVANGQDGTVLPVDVATRAAGSPIAVGAGPKGLALTKDALWVANSLDLTASRVDLATQRVVQTIPVGDGPNSVVAGSTAVWVSNEFDATVTRIDRHTNRADRRIATGGSPRGMALVGELPWVATRGFATASHKGGTLIVESVSIPGGDSIDLQYQYATPMLGLLSDGLVALRRAGGTDGLALVPDLATALPRPTDGGRTYTFTLRSGIRYSNGVQVQPEDIRRGLARALQGPGAGFYAGIVGATECIASATHCALADGVRTHPGSSNIVLRLTDPDPEFLYKLSEFVYAAAPGVPVGESKTPIPSTGPYMIANYRKGEKQLTLVRNPYFRQWSFAARPDGYPDVIKMKVEARVNRQFDDVLSGRADLIDFSYNVLPPAIAAGILRQHPAQLHSDFGLGHFYFWLDTTTPPFNDVRVRRALNLAADKNVLVALTGSSVSKAPACQFLPPNFPGYRPYCPYTRDPDTGGGYHGPDIAAARRLIAASHTAGASISVSDNYQDPNAIAVAEYLVRLLRTLGYHATRDDGAAEGGFPRHRPQMESAYWGVDFPAPSNFWGVVASCASYQPKAKPNPNPGRYCNRKVDDIAAQALELETSDPARARALWTEVGRMITDDAPWAFGVTIRQAALVSTRVGNYQSNPTLGPLLDQMWVV